MNTLNNILRLHTNVYVSQIDPDNPPTPQKIEEDILGAVKQSITADNACLPKEQRIKAPTKLNPKQIADIMLKIHWIRRVACAGINADPTYDILAIYDSEKGIYDTDEDAIKRVAQQYNYSATPKELNDVIEIIRINATRVQRTEDRDLIAVNNGIFNFVTKQLLPFSPEYVFLCKSKVNYNPLAYNVIIHNDEDNTDWDVESWMNDLSDDPEVVQLLWEILSAINRPMVSWNKSAWFIATSGCNGKGTLCELMRNLVGEGSYVSIPLADFSKDFALEPLIRASAIIVDENDVGTYLDKVGNLKAVITNDVVSINRKFKVPISFRTRGFMVQCLNEYPRIKDKSESVYRRQLYVPFEKTFLGNERKYIKDDYLHRDDVLEYVLYKTLNMSHYKLSHPKSCQLVLDEYKAMNDPIRMFMDEILHQCVWDLLPYSFLYSLYCSYMRRYNPNGIVEGKNTFIADVKKLIKDDRKKYIEWDVTNGQTRPCKKMDTPEHLIAQYNLLDWKNPTYTGGDLDKICTPMLATKYEGLLRIGNNVEQEDD